MKDARSFAIVELMGRSKAIKPEAKEGEDISACSSQCLDTCRAFLDDPENETSPLRAKVEALADACEDVLSAVDGGDGEKEETEGY